MAGQLFISQARAHSARAFLSRLAPVCGLWMVAALSCAAAAASEPWQLLRKDPQSVHKLEIVRQQLDEAGLLDVEVRAPAGIFVLLSVPADADRKRVRRIRLRVRDVKASEGVEFYPAGKEPREALDLHAAPDVKIGADGADCLLDIGSATTKTMLGGGKLQFIDFYRN